MKQVLLIDASPLFRDFLKEKLTDEKIGIETATIKRDAFTKLLSTLPELIIIDVETDVFNLNEFLLKKISAPIITKLTKHLNRRDLHENRRKLEPYQKILLRDVTSTNLRGILFETPRPPFEDFMTPPVFVK